MLSAPTRTTRSARAIEGPAIALTAGPGAMRALGMGARGTVELAFDRGGYVRVGGRWLLLAHPRAPLGPLSLLVGGLPIGGLHVGDTVAVLGPSTASAVGGPSPASAGTPTVASGRAARLVVGELRVELGGVRPAGAPCGARGVPADGWRAALAAVLHTLPSPPTELRDGIRALGAGDRLDGWMRLAGLGAGLTPTGDDVVAGHTAWCWWAGEPVAPPPPAALARCAPLGAAYIDCALRGELPGPAAAVIAAIRAGDVRLAQRRSAALATWGATSGAALVWGFGAAAGSAV